MRYLLNKRLKNYNKSLHAIFKINIIFELEFRYLFNFLSRNANILVDLSCNSSV